LDSEVKVIGLDGREYRLQLEGQPLSSEERPRSSLHLRARALLAALFPLEVRLEEVGVPSTRMSLDFFLPSRSLIIEVQGEQHTKLNGHFHRDVTDFLSQLKRDSQKRRWADLNGFALVELSHDGTDDEWRGVVLSQVGGGRTEVVPEGGATRPPPGDPAPPGE
jgi:very-short-patch-repair endonuclease